MVERLLLQIKYLCAVHIDTEQMVGMSPFRQRGIIGGAYRHRQSKDSNVPAPAGKGYRSLPSIFPKFFSS